MTENQKLEELRKEIIKAVPEIVELKFGCKVKSKNFGENNYSRTVFDIEGGVVRYCEPDGTQDDLEHFNEGRIEIIGRDITLEDCIRAWDSILNEIWAVGNGLKMCGLNPLLNKIILNWDYCKPLHLQSEETIELLHDLICKK